MEGTIKLDGGQQREIWVLAERQGERWPQVTLELLQDAQSLAKRAGWHVVAVVFAKPEAVSDQTAQELAAYGANEVMIVENEQFGRPNGPLIYKETLKELVDNRPLQILLCPSTPLWVECAAPIMSQLEGFFVSNAISFRTVQNNQLEITRYAWQNKAQLTLTVPIDCPCAIALRPNVAGVGRTTPGQKINIVRRKVDVKEDNQVEMIEMIPPDPREIDLLEAERIVAGGRGVGGQEGFDLLEELATLLEAGVGATRVAVDLGWVPYSRQIGQTGKTVKPRLYIAVGISGASQHVDGMRESDVIVAINNDPKAAIFQLADLKVVGDGPEIISALIKLLQKKQATKPVHMVSMGS
jgi:electron transfer flavoprotein alpha subunit